MDQSLFHLINEEWTSPALDLFMAALSNGEIWKPLFIGIALAALLFGGFRGRAFIVCLLLALALADPVTGILKTAFDRHRPKQVESVRMVATAKDAAGVSHALQGTGDPFFRSIRPQPCGAVISIGARGNQHDYRDVLHPLLSAARMALLVHHRSGWLFANLSGRALAK